MIVDSFGGRPSVRVLYMIMKPRRVFGPGICATARRRAVAGRRCPHPHRRAHMTGKRTKHSEERDERVKLPLDLETALRALLAVDPDDEPADDDQDGSGEDKRD
jgi:hypothetical protein